jgi:23S rRNA (uracil1939-C5)-methyltransferase
VSVPAPALVKIARLGHSGDGQTEDGRFVPFALPGDLVRFSADGRVEDILPQGPGRGSAACHYFGRCGGCALQHMDSQTYLAFKSGLVTNALAARGFADVPIDPIRAVPAGTRRRAVLKARRQGDAVQLGFFERESRILVDIESCPLLTPRLTRLSAKLRTALMSLLNEHESAELHVTDTEEGADVSLRMKRERSIAFLSALAAFANALDLARLSWNGEPVASFRAPRLHVGAYSVALAPESFLQPTVEGEAILQALVLEGVGEAKRVADLFSGVGTFALALAGKRAVHAAENSQPMLAALAASGAPHLTTEIRDLFRRPLRNEELKRFDAVVVDPPRPGAKVQAEMLAASGVPRVVYVSCNAASFARDARILADGGYRLVRVTPLDQFVWSAHIELVGVFLRPKKSKGGSR